MTNINLRLLLTRNNPEGATSGVWYGVVDALRRGFVAEVYLTRSSRGGLGLRKCVGFPTSVP